jgi:hypothetical protein
MNIVYSCQLALQLLRSLNIKALKSATCKVHSLRLASLAASPLHSKCRQFENTAEETEPTEEAPRTRTTLEKASESRHSCGGGIYCSGLDVGVPKYCDLLLRAAPYLTAYHTQSRERQPSSSVPTTLRESGKPVRRRRSSAVPVKLLYNRQALPGE